MTDLKILRIWECYMLINLKIILTDLKKMFEGFELLTDLKIIDGFGNNLDGFEKC